MIRVAIIDDHPIARRGIQGVLLESGGIDVVICAESAEDFSTPSDDLTSKGPELDVIVLDLYHNGASPCLDAVERISRAYRVLIMSASGRPEDVVNAVRAGAAGYVTKHASASMLLAAVETVAAGGFALSAPLADMLSVQSSSVSLSVQSKSVIDDHKEPKMPVRLSAREEEVLDLIADGYTHAQVARRMNITKATVDTYVERIRSKLQVGNKAQLTKAAIKRRTQPS